MCLRIGLCLLVACSVFSTDVLAQRKTKKKSAPAAPPTELTKLREEFVKATNDYKSSLAKLLTIYEGNVTKAEEKLELSRKLLAEGLISRIQVEENERALAGEKAKVDDTKRQMTNADAQIAGIFAETAAEQQSRRSK